MTRVFSNVVALVAGAVFGVGLVVAGMTHPARVLAFLDPTGAWNPSLAIVMLAAVVVYALATRAIVRRSEPWCELRFHLPTRRDIDAPLVLGAAVFGAGWGLVGLCPGPAVVAAAAGQTSALWFVLAMLAGMTLHDRWFARA